MKRTLIILLFLFTAATVMAKESKSALPVRVDGDLFISYGVFDTSDAGEYSDVVGLLASLFSVRGGISGTVRYPFNDYISAGLNLGVATMSIDTGDKKYEFIDIPINGVVRFGFENFYIEPRVGYYATIGSSLNGFSLGSTVCLGGAFIDGAYITGGELDYLRFTFGYRFNNLL